MNSLRVKIPQGRVKFIVGDLVRITKEKLKLAKEYEQNDSKEIFRIEKFMQRVSQPVYELSDLQDGRIEGALYIYELVKITVSPQTEFQIDKILRTRIKGGINQHFVKWKGYDETFNSWVNATHMKRI
jgi:hypothetical protein